jgi:hypothetical protein
VNLTDDQVQMTIYAVRDLITRRTLGGQPIPNGLHAFLNQLVSFPRGNEICGAEPQLSADEPIDTTGAAVILNCTTRRVRQIASDLDGCRNVNGRWVFERQNVIDYAEGRQAS